MEIEILLNLPLKKNFKLHSTICMCACVSVILLATVEQADGAMCLKTCRAKLAAEAEKSTVSYDTSKIFISIVLSKSCLISESCPNYKQLADWFDNSNRHLSGDFSNETGIWKRNPGVYNNDFEMYRFGALKFVTFVDPADYTRERTKSITIERTLPIFFDRKEMQPELIIPNTTRTWSTCTDKDKYGKCTEYEYETTHNATKSTGFVLKQYTGMHLDHCKHATIGWKEVGQDGLLEIINHFYDSCKESMELSNEADIIFPNTIFTDCGKHCQHLKWVANSKELAKNYLIPK